jgi:hypothetical protein
MFEGLAMMTSVGPRLPPMLDLAADAARRASQPGLLAPQPGDVAAIKPNPSLWFDALSGLVVMEFRNLAGEVQSTVPTARQLAAYRASVLTGAPLPPGLEPAGASGANGQPAPDQPEQTLRP